MSTQVTEHKLKSGDIAAHFGISDQTVRNMAERGDMPGKRVGKQWRFNLEEVQAEVNKQTDARFRRQKNPTP